MSMSVRWIPILLLIPFVLGCTQRRTENDEESESGIKPVIIVPSDPTQPLTIAYTFALGAESDASPVEQTTPTQASETPSVSFMRVVDQHLAIRTSHLDRQLLLFPALISSTHLDEPLLWQPRLPFRFQRIGAQLHLIEDQLGATATTNNLTGKVVAGFDIVEESASEIIFDFRAGALSHFLTAAFTMGQGRSVAEQVIFSGAPWTTVTGGYLRASVAGDDWFSLEHVIGNFRGVGLTFRYTFWLADASTMTPLEDDPSDGLGFFNFERYAPGNSEPHYTTRRWDISKPTTFYISSNTPPRHRAAIRDGVLAWNTIFGSAVLQAEDAPAGIRPADPRYPLIQWVEKPAKMGIGMAQAHPVTGEALVGLITISEGWATIYPGDLNALRRDGREDLPQLAGFDSGVLCHNSGAGWTGPMPIDGHVDRAFTTEEVNRLAYLQLRAVIMHEVGHVLGLRHNFAGSLHNDIVPEENLADLEAAIAGARAEDAPLPSASIMDYLTLPDDIRMTRPGDYDAAAIRAAYELPTDDASAYFFCTETPPDWRLPPISDCARRDSGVEPIDWWADELEAVAHAYSRWLVAHLVRPADAMGHALPDDIAREQRRLLYRMRRAHFSLSAYNKERGWVIGGVFPVERSGKARKILGHFFPADAPLLNASNLTAFPFVRPPLTERIRALESQAIGIGPEAPWARQILHDLDEALRHTIITR